jgi:undecaprenyl-diphosphatase
MTFFQAVIIGIIQGLTEFLPISSTAHIRIIPALLNWGDPGAAFTAVIQLGTLAAVILYFWTDILRFTQAMLGEILRGRICQSVDSKMGWMIVLGTVPIVILGLAFKKHIETTLRSLYVISVSMALLALALVAAEWIVRWRERTQQKQKHLTNVSWWDAILIGLAQCLALIPGASRSGVTITGGLFLGMTRETAARFSFLLSLPAVFGAAVLELYRARKELLASHMVTNLIIATIVSGIVGYAAIAFLLAYLKTHTTYVFVAYRLVLGVVLFALLWNGTLSPLQNEEPKENSDRRSAGTSEIPLLADR